MTYQEKYEKDPGFRNVVNQYGPLVKVKLERESPRPEENTIYGYPKFDDVLLNISKNTPVAMDYVINGKDEDLSKIYNKVYWEARETILKKIYENYI